MVFVNSSADVLSNWPTAMRRQKVKQEEAKEAHANVDDEVKLLEARRLFEEAKARAQASQLEAEDVAEAEKFNAQVRAIDAFAKELSSAKDETSEQSLEKLNETIKKLEDAGGKLRLNLPPPEDPPKNE